MTCITGITLIKIIDLIILHCLSLKRYTELTMKYFEEVSAVDQNIQNKFILKSFRLNLIFIFCFAFLVTL